MTDYGGPHLPTPQRAPTRLAGIGTAAEVFGTLEGVRRPWSKVTRPVAPSATLLLEHTARGVGAVHVPVAGAGATTVAGQDDSLFAFRQGRELVQTCRIFNCSVLVKC